MACVLQQEQFPMSNVLVDIELSHGVCVLHCKGRFASGPESDYFQSKLNEVKTMACATVLADFQQVTSIGSMGVGFIVGIYTSVMLKPSGRFVLAGVNPFVQHVLDLTRLSKIIPVVSDLSSGFAILREQSPPGCNSPAALSNKVSAKV